MKNIQTNSKKFSFLVSSSVSYIIFTARKRILQRLCFHRYLSVHRGRGMGCLPHCILGYTPLDRHLLGQTHPPWADTCLGRHLPNRRPLDRHPLDRHPLGQTPPGQTPPVQTPPSCTVHARMRSTSGRYASHWNVFLFILLLISSNNQKAKSYSYPCAT